MTRLLRGPEREEHVLYASHNLGQPGSVRGLDTEWGVSQGARRRWVTSGNVSGVPGIPGVRVDADGARSILIDFDPSDRYGLRKSGGGIDLA